MKRKQRIGRADQLFGMWAIEPGRFMQMYDIAKSVDLVALSQVRADTIDDSEDEGEEDDYGYANTGGLARFSLTGPMTKMPTCMQSLLGGTSTKMLVAAVNAAAADDTVLCGLMNVDTPGGTVDGTMALGKAIADFATKKPLIMWIDGMGCSAGYWASSQGTMIIASPTSLVGSIGTRMRLEDTSGKYAQEGVVVHEVTTGKMKAAGADGTPITDEQKQYFQGIADDMQAHFAAAVKHGRGMSDEQYAAVSDGSVYVAEKAKALGLIDQIGSEQDAIAAAFNQLFYGSRQ